MPRVKIIYITVELIKAICVIKFAWILNHKHSRKLG